MKRRESGIPFDDFRNLCQQLPTSANEISNHVNDQIQQVLESGDNALADLCLWYAAWSGRSPSIHKPLLALFAGTHGVDRHLQDSDTVTWLLNQLTDISSGNAALNRLCQHHDVGLKVLDLALQVPVGDILSEPAFDEKSCAGTIAFGMEAIAGGTDLLCVSALEQSLTVSNIALLSSLLKVKPSAIANLGDYSEQIELAERAIQENAGTSDDAFEILRRFGGRETAAMCGAILSARTEHIPVILAGPSAITSAAVLAKANPEAILHCRLAQLPADEKLSAVAKKIGLKPVFTQGIAPLPEIQAVLAASMMRSSGLLVAS